MAFDGLDRHIEDFKESLGELVGIASVYGDEDTNDARIYTNLWKLALEIKQKSVKSTEILSSLSNKTSQEILQAHQSGDLFAVSTDVSCDPEYTEFEKDIKHAFRIDPQMFKDQFLSGGSTDEFVAMQENINTICPITKQEIEKAVRNKRCNHIYEKNAISGEEGRFKCPVVGCMNRIPILKQDLIDDILFNRMLKLERNKM